MSTQLPTIPSVSRLSENVIRILGQNPGKYTLEGTNTYLVGQSNPYILIDTGEGFDSYIPYLSQALKDNLTVPSKPDISDIVITHKHHDHTDGLPSVLALLRQLWNERRHSGTADGLEDYTLPKIHKFPLVNEEPEKRLALLLNSLQEGTYTPSATGTPLHDLSEDQLLPVTNSSSKPSPLSHLQIIHIPGHTTDSIALYFPTDQALFTADTVLGYGTSVFEDLGAYMSSLQKLIDFNQRGGGDKGGGEGKYQVVYPGHGPIVEDGPALIATYLHHRIEREEQVIAHLKTPLPPSTVPSATATSTSSGDTWTLWSLVATIYKEYPKDLWEPAAHGLGLHLLKLEADGKVVRVGGEGKDSQWRWVG